MDTCADRSTDPWEPRLPVPGTQDQSLPGCLAHNFSATKGFSAWCVTASSTPSAAGPL
jgi:hypothetical protein